LTQYDRYLREQLAPLVRRELIRRLEKRSVIVEEQLKSDLIQIIRNCQLQLYRNYEKSKNVTDTPQEGSGIAVRESSTPDLAAYRPVESPPEDTANFDYMPELQNLEDSLLLNFETGGQLDPNSDSGYGSMAMVSSDAYDAWFTDLCQGEMYGESFTSIPSSSEDTQGDKGKTRLRHDME
jgi:hypothetical protein